MSSTMAFYNGFAAEGLSAFAWQEAKLEYSKRIAFHVQVLRKRFQLMLACTEIQARTRG